MVIVYTFEKEKKVGWEQNRLDEVWESSPLEVYKLLEMNNTSYVLFIRRAAYMYMYMYMTMWSSEEECVQLTLHSEWSDP